MANGVVRYLLEAVGGPQVRQALRGIVGESRAADRAILASSRATTTARGRMSRQEGSDAHRGAQMRVRAETAADRAILASAQARSREEQRLRRAEERDIRRMLRDERPRGQGGRGGAIRAMGGAALAVADALTGRVQGWQGALGVPSRDELIRRTMQSQLGLIRMSTSAGMTESQSAELQARVTSVARATGADPMALVEALGAAQTRFASDTFPALQIFSENLQTIASAAKATDAPVGDMVNALGEFRRQMGVTSEQMPQVLGLMVDGMNQGSLEAGDVAANFSPLMSEFATLRGEGGRGVGGATEFLALAQALGASGAGPEGTRTLLQNLMANLRRNRTQGNLETALGDTQIFDDAGQLQLDFGTLMQRIAASPNMQSASAMEDVFGNDMQAVQARTVLLNAIRQGDNPITRLMGASGSRGLEYVDTVNQRIDSSAAGEAGRIASDTASNFMENGDDLIRVMNAAVGPFSELTSQYPLATEALGVLREAASAASSALGGIGLMNLAFGGGGGAAVASAVGGGGGVAALGTAGAMVAPAVLGLAAVGGVGYQLYSDQQRVEQEQQRRAAAERVIASDLSLVTPENLANATGSTTLVRDAERSRTQRQLRSSADANMASFMGGPNEVTGEVRIADASVDAIGRAAARAIDRGAPAAGRQPGETGRRR